jgi:hypothetical protein
VVPVAQAITASSGTFAARSPLMIRDSVGWEMPVSAPKARWLEPGAAAAFSIRFPTVTTPTHPLNHFCSM